MRQKYFRYIVLFLLFLVCTINYLDRIAISYAIEPIKGYFLLTNAQFGLCMSFFAFGTLLVNGVSGYLADVVKSKWLLGISWFFWSIIMILSGFVSFYISFILLRFFLGVLEGVNFPVINKVVESWCRPTEHSRSMSFALAGVPLACFIGGPLISLLIVYFKWWGAFVFLGIISLFCWVLFILLFKEYSIKDINRKTVGRGSIIESNKYCFNLESIKFCLTSKMLIANYVAVFAFGYLLFFYLTWLPGYLIEKFNLNILSVGYLSSIPWAIATVMVIAGGCLSDLLLKKTKSKRVAHVHLFWIFMLLSSLSSVLLVFSESIAIDITVMSLALGFGLASNSLFFSLCRDISPNYVGAATGVAITFFSLSGIISPYLTGILRDSYGSFDSAIMVLSTIMFFSALLLIIFCKPDEH